MDEDEEEEEEEDEPDLPSPDQPLPPEPIVTPTDATDAGGFLLPPEGIIITQPTPDVEHPPSAFGEEPPAPVVEAKSGKEEVDQKAKSEFTRP
jgi:hypothetical protein